MLKGKKITISFSTGLMSVTEQGCWGRAEVQALPDCVIGGSRSALNKVGQNGKM